MRVDTELAYILHKRPFRDSSQILDVFTREHGRISLMSRGSRGARSKTGSPLQLFRPLLVSWQGRGEMPYLNNAEMAEIAAPKLAGHALISAMYVNELLVYLLHKHDVHKDVFEHYHECLYALCNARNIEIVLRLFEKSLLQALGFGLNLVCDADTGEAVEDDRHYVYHYEHGPVLCDSNYSSMVNPVVSGDSLVAYDQNRLESRQQCVEIKALMRYVLKHQLGQRQLKSRELFRKSVIPG